jgi:phage tail-like protein
MSGAIILLDSEGKHRSCWIFKNAYPVKWVGPDLKSDGNEVVVETLELAHEGLEKG